MKTNLLDNTLGNIFEEDGFNILDNSNEIDSFLDDDIDRAGTTINISGIDLDSLVKGSNCKEFSNLQDIKNNQKNTFSLVNTNENNIIKNFEPKEVIKQNETARGENLNKKKDIPPIKESSTKSSSLFKRTGIAFNNQTFSIRNPRKPLSRKSSEMSQNSNLLQNSSKSQLILPDLETILIQKAKRRAELSAEPSVSTTLPNSKTVLKEIDIGWLERASVENGISANNVSIRPANTAPKTYGLGNIDLTKLKRLSNVKENNVDIETLVADKIEVCTSENNDNKKYEEDEVVAESDNDEDIYRQSLKRRKVLQSNTTTTNDLVIDNISKQHDLKVNELCTETKIKTKKIYKESSSDENFDSGLAADQNLSDKRYSKSSKTRSKGVRAKKKKVSFIMYMFF